MCLFRKDFQRNHQDSIQMADVTKRNLNVHFILGNTGHAWHRLTVTILLLELQYTIVKKQYFRYIFTCMYKGLCEFGSWNICPFGSQHSFFFHCFSLDDTAAALMRNPQILAALQVCHYHYSCLLTNNISL